MALFRWWNPSGSRGAWARIEKILRSATVSVAPFKKALSWTGRVETLPPASSRMTATAKSGLSSRS